MPTATLSAERVAHYAGRPIAASEWADLLFPSKAEFKALAPPDGLEVEATPDRLDLLCDAGLGRYLAGALSGARGAPPLRPGPPSRIGGIDVAESVAPLRPYVAAVELTPPDGSRVSLELLSEAIRFQELLHATVGGGRRLASFGLYALERIRGPVTYRAEPASSVRFVPLDASEEVEATTFLEEHPMARAYGAFGRTTIGPLVLRDAAGSVLSLPPILNAEGPGSVRPADGPLLLESTGLIAARVADGLGLLMLPFVAAGWSVSPVAIRTPSESPSAPDPLAQPILRMRRSTLDRLVGEVLPDRAVRNGLAMTGLDATEAEGGWNVRVPPWRPDLLQEVDLVEDVVLARGIAAADGRLSPSLTRGHRRAESVFRDRVRVALLGAGFSALFTPMLTARDRNGRLGRGEAMIVAHPVSEEYAVIRDRLFPSLIAALAHNVRAGYPQRIGEVGPAIVPDPAAEAGGRTTYRAGFLEASDRAGFAEVAARVDALLRPFGAIGVREPAELGGLIPGRSAVLRIAGVIVAEMGEVQPEVLEAERIPVPVAYAEIDLTALWPLVRATETA